MQVSALFKHSMWPSSHTGSKERSRIYKSAV